MSVLGPAAVISAAMSEHQELRWSRDTAAPTCDHDEASPLRTAPAPGPSWRERLLYGLPGMPNHLIQKYLRLWNDLFYLNTLNAPLQALALFDTVLSGTLMLLLPVFGSFSDRLATRWGRRRPLLAVLAPMAALGFLGLMWVPSHATTVVLVWYMAFSLLQRSQVALQLCYRALGAQMSLKSHQRVRVFAWASAFGGVGLIMGTAVPTYLSTEWQYRAFGIAVAVSIVAFYGVLVLFVKERSDLGQRKDGQQIVPTIVQACGNYPFVLYLLSQAKDSLSLQESYAFKWLFHLDKHQIFVAFLVTYGTAFLISLVWTKLGRRMENKHGAILGYVFTVLSVTMSLFLPEEAKAYTFGLAIIHSVLEGIGVGSRNTFLPAVAADCVEYDQLLHGNRREAQFKTTEDVITSFYGLGYGVSLALLGAVGFDTKAATQLEPALWMMRSLQLFKIATHLMGIFALYKFPITHHIHQDITQQAVVRQKGLSAIDPLTGRMLAPFAAHLHSIPTQVRANFDHFGLWEWKLVQRFRHPIKALSIVVANQVALAISLLVVSVMAAVFTCFGDDQKGASLLQVSSSKERNGNDLSWLLPIEVTFACLALGWLLFNALRIPILFALSRAWNAHAAFLCDYTGAAKSGASSAGEAGVWVDDWEQACGIKPEEARPQHKKGTFLSINGPLLLPQ